MKRKQFTFYRSFWEAVKDLPNEDRLKALDAIIGYALDGDEPGCGGVSKSIFVLVKPVLDSARRMAEGASKPKPSLKPVESLSERLSKVAKV